MPLLNYAQLAATEILEIERELGGQENLQDVMQLVESCVFPNLDSTPDGWVDITQRHFELV